MNQIINVMKKQIPYKKMTLEPIRVFCLEGIQNTEVLYKFNQIKKQ